MEFINQNTIRMCKKGSNCCPIIEKTDDGFQVSDDFGGLVKLDREQAAMLKEALEHFEDKNI